MRVLPISSCFLDAHKTLACQASSETAVLKGIEIFVRLGTRNTRVVYALEELELLAEVAGREG